MKMNNGLPLCDATKNVLKDIFSTFQSTRQQRKDHHPDLIQHTGHYYDSNSGVGSRPPKRFSRY